MHERQTPPLATKEIYLSGEKDARQYEKAVVLAKGLLGLFNREGKPTCDVALARQLMNVMRHNELKFKIEKPGRDKNPEPS